VTLDLPLWPAHLLVSIGLFVTTLMMAIDLAAVRKGRSSLLVDGSRRSMVYLPFLVMVTALLLGVPIAFSLAPRPPSAVR